MEHIQIHVLHTGTVAVAPALPFGGANCNIIKASGIFEKRSNRLWLPVSCYYIEHPKGKILVDCGWHRNMSPDGTFSPMAQIKSLGSPLLFLVNQGMLPPNAAINEQLQKMGVLPSDLDYVLLTHLDCDHANGLALVQEAKHIMVSADELHCARAHSKIRYQKKWWSECNLTAFAWNGTEGPAGNSYDLFNDGSVVLIAIPGHSDGQFAVKIKNSSGKFVLLFSDGGYAEKSWKEMLPSGIAVNREMQMKSLAWIKAQSMDKDCIASLANHDAHVIPHTILL